MCQRLLFLIAMIILPVSGTSSKAHADTVEITLSLIANTADRICGVVKDTGSATNAAAKGVVNVELRGLATQLDTAGVQGSGGITTDAYQGLMRDQLGPVLQMTAQCKVQVFQTLQVKLLPNYTYREVPSVPLVRDAPVSSLACRNDQVVNWLDQHGIYGNRSIDISVYSDVVSWTVNGKPSRKTIADIAKEEEIFRRIYPMQRYTPTTSSVAMVGGQCVLTQVVDGYKKSATGKVEFNNFRFAFGIRNDAGGPRIVERQTDVLSSTH